jgi:hypothetical protein
MRCTLSNLDIAVLIEALEMAASRHESMARAQKFGRHHDLKAEAMRRLRLRLYEQKHLGVTVEHAS